MLKLQVAPVWVVLYSWHFIALFKIGLLSFVCMYGAVAGRVGGIWPGQDTSGWPAGHKAS
jgi:hypothetical protein